MPRRSREEWKTYENIFDKFTIKTLFDLTGTGFFDALESPIALGKEANIFTALKGKERVCVKIYRLETCDFRRMYEYIRTDPRYIELRHHRRKIIFAWTQREFRNLLKAREAGIRCPTPIKYKNNILVMEFIGENKAYPLLKDRPPINPKLFFNLVLDEMKKMCKNDLIHGDLSEYNVLNVNEKPVIIDFSHATQFKNPEAQMLFDRDIKNICRYFKKLGLKVTEQQIKKKIQN
ncbi:serine protein kinase RIO [Candidatus Woesearchaeota archaeon]|nr:serine protein kinase RIO [Candidatus Woesearchaeota archaeon]